jgi:pyruvate formate lyase activating enzyme
MKEALFYSKKRGYAQCELCPQKCRIKTESAGVCGVRRHVDGRLFSASYGRITRPNLDPIEKKPLYHFLPGTITLSFGTYGCNLKCAFCQNHHLSHEIPENYQHSHVTLPEEVVRMAEHFKAPSISYTYNEPTVFVEFVLECAKLAREKNIKNVLVTNGYTNPEPIKALSRVVDAANVDLKSFSEDFYRKNCAGSLEPVKRSIEQYKKAGVWVEITSLIIPGENDSTPEIKRIADWVASVDTSMPLHLSRFYPHYRMIDKNPTPLKTLEHAKKICENRLDYVYVGNVGEEQNTICTKCGGTLVKRSGYSVKNYLEDGKCHCGQELPGVF